MFSCFLLAYLSETGKTRVSMMFSSAASVRVKLTRLIIKVGITSAVNWSQ